MPRYSIDVTDDERDQLKAMAMKEERSMMSIMRVVFRRGLRVSISTSEQRQSDVKVTSDPRQSDACPDPAPLTHPDPDPEAEEEERRGDQEKEGNRKGSVRGNLLFGQVAEHVISEMNRIAGKKWMAKAWKPKISKLLAKGFTQDDLMTVVHWKAEEAKRNGDWQWFKPDTLFKPTLFAEKLDNAKAGVKLGDSPKQSITQKQARQQNFALTPELRKQGWT